MDHIKNAREAITSPPAAIGRGHDAVPVGPQHAQQTAACTHLSCMPRANIRVFCGLRLGTLGKVLRLQFIRSAFVVSRQRGKAAAAYNISQPVASCFEDVRDVDLERMRLYEAPPAADWGT